MQNLSSSIDVETGATQWLDHKPFPMNYPPYLGYFIAGRAWWDQDNRHAYAIYKDTARTNTHLLRWDTETGESRVLFKEDADTRAILGDTDKKRVMATPLPHSDEVVWFSERSGWAHLYLYDLKTGECKNAITQGAWLVRDILKLDEVNRELWIKTAGRIDHHNPYHTDICRVNIDTGHLTPLSASDHEYSAFGPKDFLPIYQTLQSVSPDHRFVVTTRSRVDERPVSVLLNREGETLCTVETADLSRMPGGWQFPDITETVAEDGETNIYGMMFKPSNFSADKSYPVLDFSFVMMADPVAAFGSGMNAYLYCEAAAYAELGFIVVKFFNRGLAGYREKAFHDHVDHSLPFYNLADNAASIKQLTTQHAYMDYQRVGITLHSSFPTALTGLFIYPDVYKVGVTYNAMTDARLLPLEDEMGGADFPQLEAFAKNLQGKLLMIAGMMDYCVPVSSTFRIVEALKKENKNFDMLILPNLSHADDGYAIRRQWDYLVTHLLGVDPPENVELTL